MHLVGAAVKRATGVRWVADLRDSLVAHPHRDAQRLVVRVKEQGQQRGRRGRRAQRRRDRRRLGRDRRRDARALAARRRCVTISNGSDFDDFAGLEYHPASRPVPDHARRLVLRQARPAAVPDRARRASTASSARFVGDFRSPTANGRPGSWTAIELIPYAPHRRALELQRDSEALLLLIPEADGRGRGVLSGKVFEYLAAERPILALVPPDGAAAELLRETGAGVVVAPDDVDGIARELTALRDRWRAGALDGARPQPRVADEGLAAHARRGARRRCCRALERRGMRKAHELLLPRDALLLHVREGALERRRARVALSDILALVLPRLRSRSSSRSRVPLTTARAARLLRRLRDRLPDRLLQPRHARRASRSSRRGS